MVAKDVQYNEPFNCSQQQQNTFIAHAIQLNDNTTNMGL